MKKLLLTSILIASLSSQTYIQARITSTVGAITTGTLTLILLKELLTEKRGYQALENLIIFPSYLLTGTAALMFAKEAYSH